jgi:trk system potassium uptake protein TrkH
LIISVLEENTLVGITGTISTVGNIGPGLGHIIGPLGSYNGLHDISKLILSVDMYVGRLELIPFLVLFQKDLWRIK